MDYAELTAAVVSTIGNTFPAADMARFAQQAEQKIYNAVQLPALRKTASLTLAIGAQSLTLPLDYLYTYSLAVLTPVTGEFTYLLNKDVNYLRDMFPLPSARSRPRAYAQSNANTLTVAPTADVAYTLELNYGFYPESIVTAGNTWLGDTFDSALFNCMLVEAARFIKEEPDVMAVYNQQFLDSMMLLKQLGDGKLRQDTFRTPQVRDPVR